MTEQMFKKIKKLKGEAFAKAIRAHDAGIFKIKNLDEIVRYAGRNVDELLPFLVSLKPKNVATIQSGDDPISLLAKAGYDAFYVNDLKTQNSIQKYFRSGEELCTFSDDERFKDHYIIHAIKKGADKLNRNDFNGKEAREDAYGTSVISIQINKETHAIKITNRYNHAVDNPDNTFESNPDNIISGLSSALEQHFSVKLNAGGALPKGHYIWHEGKVFYFNCQNNYYYFGENFIAKKDLVIDMFEEFEEINPDYQIIVEDFIINLKDRCVQQTKFKQFLTEEGYKALYNILQQELDGKKLTVRESNGFKIISADGKDVLKVQAGKLEGIMLQNVTELPDRAFNNHYSNLKEVYMPHVVKVGNFVLNNPSIQKICAPELKVAGNGFIRSCHALKEVSFPLLKVVGMGSFSHNPELLKFDLPELEKSGRESFVHLYPSGDILLPKLKELGEDSFCYLDGILNEKNNPSFRKAYKIILPQLGKVQDRSFRSVDALAIELSNVQTVGDDCFYRSNFCASVEMPCVKVVGRNTFTSMPVKEINYPKLEKIGYASFSLNNALKKATLLSYDGRIDFKLNPCLKQCETKAVKLRRENVKVKIDGVERKITRIVSVARRQQKIKSDNQPQKE